MRLIALGSLLSLLSGCGPEPAAAAGTAEPAAWEDLDATRPGTRLRDPRSGLTFVRVEAGEFVMGSERTGEGPPRTVRISHPFLVATTEATIAAFRRGAGGSGAAAPAAGADELPMPCSFADAQRFCAWFGYRLPTEAEWEFAALGGLPADAPAFRNPARVAEAAWLNANAGDGARPVATRAPNPFGLHDMIGNLWEWCSDWHAADYRGRPDPDVDPHGPPEGLGRVLRGGSWFTPPGVTPQSRTVDAADVRNDFYGFRPVAELPR